MKTCSWQDVDKINRNISAGEKKANDIIFDYQWGDKKDKPFSIKEFDNEFRKNQPISKSFYAFAENEIEILKHKKNAKSQHDIKEIFLEKLLKNWNPGKDQVN